MLSKLESEKVLKEVPQLEESGRSISRGIHRWVLQGGKDRRGAADLLHGTWLGHPLHSVLTDLTIGAWVLGYGLDLLNLVSRSKRTRQAADGLLNIGNLSAVATALAGLTDYSAIPQEAVSTGTTHGLLNLFAFVVNLLSAGQRRKGRRSVGFLLSSMSTGILLLTAWLGGEMVYRYKVGVNRIPQPPEPEDWQPTIDDHLLFDRTPKRVDVQGMPVLLYRDQGQIFAIGAVCGHAGGPLDEGSFNDHCVTCPWHQSVYDLRDGSVVHGPTTYTEPSYDVRIEQGKIEVRKKETTETSAAAHAIQVVVQG